MAALPPASSGTSVPHIHTQYTGQTAEATECYEAALAQQPDNEEYARELFFGYCRQCAYAKAQQLATRLYKQFSQPQYLFWCVSHTGLCCLSPLIDFM